MRSPVVVKLTEYGPGFLLDCTAVAEPWLTCEVLPCDWSDGLPLHENAIAKMMTMATMTPTTMPMSLGLTGSEEAVAAVRAGREAGRAVREEAVERVLALVRAVRELARDELRVVGRWLVRAFMRSADRAAAEDVRRCVPWPLVRLRGVGLLSELRFAMADLPLENHVRLL